MVLCEGNNEVAACQGIVDLAPNKAWRKLKSWMKVEIPGSVPPAGGEVGVSGYILLTGSE